MDISATGTDLGLVDGSSSDLFPIGFNFRFYGREYSEVNVGSNGVIYFGTDAYLGLSNICLPAETGYGTDTNTLIATYWDDLAPSQGGGRVLYEVRGSAPNRTLVIMWDDVPRYGELDGMTFEAILSERDGSMTFQYLRTDPGATATVGIEDLSQRPSCGLEYECNAGGLTDGLAIRFDPGQASAAVPALSGEGIALLTGALLFVGFVLLRRRPRCTPSGSILTTRRSRLT